MLYATHSMDEVARIADQLVLLDRGTLAAAGVLSGRLDLPLTDRPDVGAILLGRSPDMTMRIASRASPSAKPRPCIRTSTYRRGIRCACVCRRATWPSPRNGRRAERVERPPLPPHRPRRPAQRPSGAAMLAVLAADSARRHHLQAGQQVFALMTSVASSALV
jgi:hypothetical protein